MKAIERLIEYLHVKKINNFSFEKDLGLSNGYISPTLNRKSEIGQKIIMKIMEHCTDLNIDWLMFGHGEMLKNDNPYFQQEVEQSFVRDQKINYNCGQNDICIRFFGIVESQQETIKTLSKLLQKNQSK